MTSEVVQTFALGTKPLRFFSVVARVVTGAPVTTEEARQTFWDSVAFYNYVQELAGTGPRQRPTRAMWDASTAPFAQVLEALRPQCMLILGKQLAANLPKPHHPFSLGEVSGEQVMARSHLLEDGTPIPALTISHPSSGRLAYATWDPRVRLLLELASVGSAPKAR